jgi:CRISPR-associated endonuclease/helicase Cas3
MSATMNQGELKTIDVRNHMPSSWNVLRLSEADHADERLGKRYGARKKLKQASLSLDTSTRATYAQSIAEMLRDINETRGGQTIAVFNQVDRAQDTYHKLKTFAPDEDVLLLHSRFRASERLGLARRLCTPVPEGKRRVVIATQAIEAGVDITSRTLVTELASWDSMVQRFGRCNRYGEESEAHVYWTDIAACDENGKSTKEALPYEPHKLEAARKILVEQQDVGPTSVANLHDNLVSPVHHVIRCKDLLQLFDTTPDLAGADNDISRFIRDDEDLDIQVYWREVGPDGPATDQNTPRREEVCSVSVGAFRDFVAKRCKEGRFFWVWDYLDGRWQPLRADQIRPGIEVLVDSRAGGYLVDSGWMASSKTAVPCIAVNEDDQNEGNSDDPPSHIGRFVALKAHSDDVVQELSDMSVALALKENDFNALSRAARLHDWGKIHPIFQAMLTERREGDTPVPGAGPWAKSDRMSSAGGNALRPQFRHELASALAALAQGESDLVSYLIAAHHGKVRLSIRSMPKELIPEDGRRFARGIWEGDILPPIHLGGGVTMPAITLDLRAMELGRAPNAQPSWLERTLRLRDHFGPFYLAYLEAIIRAADRRASAKEARS